MSDAGQLVVVLVEDGQGRVVLDPQQSYDAQADVEGGRVG